MTERIRIDSTASSPFRVSAAGTDVDLAEFNTLIFDGNQPPLRLWATGYVTVAGISDADFVLGKNVSVASSGVSFATPSGTEAVFITQWRNPDPGWDSFGALTTPSFSNRRGGGGGLCSHVFVGANMWVGIPGTGSTPGPSIYVNYCVFKDYN